MLLLLYDYIYKFHTKNKNLVITSSSKFKALWQNHKKTRAGWEEVEEAEEEGGGGEGGGCGCGWEEDDKLIHNGEFIR